MTDYRSLLVIFIVISSSSCQFSPNKNTTASQQSPLSVLIMTSIYPAHFFPLVALGEELVNRGHNVTMVGPTMEGYEGLSRLAKEKGIKFISSGFEDRSHYDAERQAGKHDGQQGGFLMVIYNLTLGSPTNRTNNYLHRVVETLKKLTNEYNYIISDNAVLPAMFYLVKNWDTDRFMLHFAPVPLHPLSTNPWPYPAVLSSTADNMSFTDRLINTILYRPMFWLGLQMMEYYFNMDEDMSTDEPVESFIGVKYPVIYNTLFGFDWPRTTLPLQHYVGPMISPTYPPLDDAVSKWLQDKPAKSVIYVSMGTSVDVTSEVATAIQSLTTDHYVLWSTRNDLSIFGVKTDTNIYVTSWVSQLAVLNHSSISCSIMQCGLTSVQESLYFSVPVICIPAAFDQYDVSLRLQSQGLGTRIVSTELNQESLRKALDFVNGIAVREKARKMAKIMRANGGAKTAASLVELYAEVGHEHGIPSYAKYNWTWYQFHNVDVYLTILTICILFVLISYKLCSKYSCSCCTCKCVRKLKSD